MVRPADRGRTLIQATVPSSTGFSTSKEDAPLLFIILPSSWPWNEHGLFFPNNNLLELLLYF
jgi:hypothetical protein